jgi:pentose-5-phosphate-3-epimerase
VVEQAGAKILVAGSAVFGAENPAEALKELLRAA